MLRGPEARDWEGFCAFFTSERARYVGGSDSRRKAWMTFAAEVGHWQLRGYGFWAVTLKGAGDCLGMVGCWYPETWTEREIGWTLWPEAEGRGIGYEAALASRTYAYDTLGWETAVSYIDPANARSVRLAERLGAVRDEAAAHPFDADTLVYRHPAPEALQ